MKRTRSLFALVAAAAAGLSLWQLNNRDGEAALRSNVSASGGTKLIDDRSPDDWSAFGRTYGEQHYSPLESISTGNIGKVGLQWY